MPETQHPEPTHSIVHERHLELKNINTGEQIEKTREIFRVLVDERARTRNIELTTEESELVNQWISDLKIFTDQQKANEYFNRKPDPFAMRLMMSASIGGYFTATNYRNPEFNIPYIYMNPLMSKGNFAQTMVHELSHAADWAVDNVLRVRANREIKKKDYIAAYAISHQLNERSSEGSTVTIGDMFRRTMLILGSEIAGSLALTYVEMSTRPESHYPLIVQAALAIIATLAVTYQPGYTDAPDEIRARATEKRVKRKVPFAKNVARMLLGRF